MLAALVFSALVGLPASDQDVVFYNSRIALREKRPADALKLWLLRNVLVSQEGKAPTRDADFGSVVWAAMGELGVCPDGYPDDNEGAGIWAIAAHNWVIRAMARGAPPDEINPFDAFDVGVQRRFVSLYDVVNKDEMRTVRFLKGKCSLPNRLAADKPFNPFFDIKDREEVAELLRYLLTLAMESVDQKKVRNAGVLEARIFDLDLAVAEFRARAARRQDKEFKQRAKDKGVPDPGAVGVQEPGAKSLSKDDSAQAQLLKRALTWDPSVWLALERDRRLFLFERARVYSEDPKALQRLTLAMIDGLVSNGLVSENRGSEIEIWMSRAEGYKEEVVLGERGQKLLSLDAQSGFRERGVVALYRGVAFLQQGQLTDALRSFAMALHYAETSRQADGVAGLSRRWLSFVLSRHETNAEVIATLGALVPRYEYNAVVEDLVWRAALTADAKSFDLAVAGSRGNSAFARRVDRLRPLAHASIGGFVTEIAAALEDEPYLTMRFLRMVVERIEAEERSVRLAHRVTLSSITRLLVPLAAPGTPGAGGGAGQRRAANELLERIAAVREGLGDIDDPTGADTKARALAPSSETYAGSIRLAPNDALPWPFVTPQVSPPSAFTSITLVPEEWPGDGAVPVFGWRIGG